MTGIYYATSRISPQFAHLNPRTPTIVALHPAISDSTVAARAALARWNGLALDAYYVPALHDLPTGTFS